MHRLLYLVTILLPFLISCNNQKSDPHSVPDKQTEIDSSTVEPVEIKYDNFGFRYDSSRVSDFRVKRNESLYEILDRFEVSPQQIYSITREAQKVVNLKSFRPGQNYRIYASSDTSGSISRLVWQPDAVDYVVFDWQDSLQVYKEQKEITTKHSVASAQINSSLYEAMMTQELSPMLANKLSEIYAWEIDFFGLREGDSFKIYYEKKYVDDTFYGTGEILAAEFTHRGETYKAFQFSDDRIGGYFDEEGKSVQKTLLKAPFNYNQRISSRFSHNRFHPVLKRRMPHFGVDYAAPYGTPVLSTGDGTVIEAQYRGANGNIAKIRHNNTYTTVYLHLKGFASGIRRGATVKQGEVIGYVGKTGRVTGTHLDYRIYKHGSPVNPLTVDLPASRSIPTESMKRFTQVKKYLKQKLDRIEEPTDDMMITKRPAAIAR